MFRVWFTMLLLLVVGATGCAGPAPRADLEGARGLVARAYSLGADHLAIEHYQKAFAALGEGEAQTARGDHASAREAFLVAEHYARLAISAAHVEKLRMEEEFRAREEAQRQRQAAEAAQRPAARPESRPSDRPVPLASPAPSPEPVVPTVPVPDLVNSYDVQIGDTLWLIAARPEVYGDPLLWPLLYKSNRDQIKDPRKVYTGQTLDVPRNTSEREMADVRAQARQSELFPVSQLLPASDPVR